MTTTRCPRCKQPLSPNATACPHCRPAKPAPGQPLGLWLGLAAGAAFVAAFALGLAGFTAYWLITTAPTPVTVAEAPLPLPDPPVAPPQVPPPQDEPKAAPPQVQPKAEPPRVQPKAEPPPVEPAKPAPPKAELPKVELPKTEPPRSKPVEPSAQAPLDSIGQDELVARLLQQVNTYRKTAGLDAVRLDTELSKGCAAHARYLALNPPAPAQSLLDEDPAKDGSSDAGRQAARVALVSISAAKNAVEQWMGQLNGRLPLLNPKLGAVGIGVEPLPRSAWAIVIDAVHGVGTAEHVVVYPGAGQQDVPVTGAGGSEVPEPNRATGYPVTVQFPLERPLSKVQAQLLDDAGQAVPVWTTTPDTAPDKKWTRNLVALVPKQPLVGGQSYQVRVSAELAGKPWAKTWSFTTEDDTDRQGMYAQQAVAKVNAVRKLAGLAPVTLDPALSTACLAHARYLVLNLDQPASAGLGAHNEDLSLPGATPAGKKAGQKSNINIGAVNPLEGVDAWMATLYHRVPILEPHLKTVGFACARARWLGWVTVLDVQSGRDPRLPRPDPVYYPAPDQTDVPLHFPIGGEVPDPLPDNKTGRAGYPITAFFPRSSPLESATGSLTDSAGRDIPCWFSSAEQPANPHFAQNQGNTVCLIPRAPLRPNTEYHVWLRGQRDGAGWLKDWHFTTGGGGPTASDAATQVMRLLNGQRAAAGLGALSLDTALSRGCQAHAEYLLRNGTTLADKKIPFNDENPELPGFTPEGKKAAGQTHVFLRALRPTAQLEYILGTVQWRTYLLNPRLERLGLGFANNVGQGWCCVLDPFGGRGGGERVVLYPAPDQEAVPCVGGDRLPGKATPLGYPVSVTFPPNIPLLGGKGTLTDADGNKLDTILATPEQPLSAKQPLRSTICLYPRAPLQPGRTYTATLSVVVNGQTWRQTWRFTTE